MLDGLRIIRGFMWVGVFLCINRSKFTGGNREWIVAAGQKWARKSLYTDNEETIPANGCSGRTQCANYYIRLVQHLKVSDLPWVWKQLKRRIRL